jgi:NIMA (never in mitosis gene a)-related kinase
MEELYKKVMRGNYPRIPSKYSEDLSDAIKLMIQVEAGARPSCEELLKMPMITKRIEFFNNNKDIDITEEQNESLNKKFELLKTIIVPNKLENLAKNLPKPNYDTEGNIRSFQNSNRNVHKQYGSLTLSNTDLLPNIKKDKIIIKKNIENNSKSIITESNKPKIQIINRNNRSLNAKENNYEYRPRIPKSLPKNDIMIKNKPRINKNLVLPNLYGNYKANISLKNLNVNNKNNASYKIMNSENNISKNNMNLNNIKVIDGKNIYGNNKNNNNSIGLKKRKYLINQVNNDIGKMMIEKISKPKPFNYNLNNYSKGNMDKEFLKIIHQRKKRMIYLGKI